MPEGWFSFLFPHKSKEKDTSEQPTNAVTKEPNALSIETNVQSRVSPKKPLTTTSGSISPSFRGGIQSPSPPPSSTNLSESPPFVHDVISQRPPTSSSRPRSDKKSAPPSLGNKKRISNGASQTSPKRSGGGSPFKLPPSPASLSSAVPWDLPSTTATDFEAMTAQNLKGLLKSVPAKTLHSYLASRVNKLAPSELISLQQVLSELEPPPLLHCVRCHNDFTDIENTDHSCQVPHDDESAAVQYRAKTKTTLGGHETFYACCGQTVEGEGELGPPDGWCYEGRHTVDVKRARWRDDSTIHDDKLISCAKKRCFKELESPSSPRKTRERGRKRTRVEDVDEDMDDARSVKSRRQNASPSPSAMSFRSTRSTKRRVSPPLSVRSTASRSQRKVRERVPSPPLSAVDGMSPPPFDIGFITASQPVASSSKVRPKSKSRTTKSKSKLTTTVELLQSAEAAVPAQPSSKRTKASSMRPRSQSVVSTTSVRNKPSASAVAAMNTATTNGATSSTKGSRKRALTDASERVGAYSETVSDSETERQKEREKTKKTKKLRVS